MNKALSMKSTQILYTVYHNYYSRKIWQVLNLANWLSEGIGEFLIWRSYRICQSPKFPAIPRGGSRTSIRQHPLPTKIKQAKWNILYGTLKSIIMYKDVQHIYYMYDFSTYANFGRYVWRWKLECVKILQAKYFTGKISQPMVHGTVTAVKHEDEANHSGWIPPCGVL